jgi:hypothetical protein
MESAHGWLQSLPDLGDLSAEKIEHGYDVRSYLDSFESQDQGLLQNFLNHASRSGWDQSDVTAAVEWYLQWSEDAAQGEVMDAREAIEDIKFIESQDRIDRDRARNELRETWGEEADANIALINQRLDRMSANERQFYESAGPDGSLRLNNPEVLERLAGEARASIPAVLSEAARQYGSEKVALEMMMANRSSPYWRGPDAVALQSRYRDLISSGDTGNEQPLPTGSGIAEELSRIEHTMRTNFNAYRRDEKMQARYRQLLELTGG